jgi:hypothetical protein
MKVITGPQSFANETTTSNHLSRFAVNRPELLANVATLFKNDITPLTSLLMQRGNNFSGDIFSQAAKDRGYTAVGSREIRWNVKGIDTRVGHFVADFACEAYPLEPGKNHTEVTLYADTDWFSPRDVCELGDNRTQIFFHSDDLPVEASAGVWKYRAKLNSKDDADFIDPFLIKENGDFSVLYNMFEEASETAYEKYTFNEQAATFMTIMRLKWSITGTASAMKSNTPIWVEHNGVSMWMDQQEFTMLKNWAQYRENQSLFGKGTVGDDNKIKMKLANGIEVMAGDGLLYQGDGVWRLPYAPGQLSRALIDTTLQNMKIETSYNNQDTAVAMLCGTQFNNNFGQVMLTAAGTDPRTVEVDGTKKGINMTYDYYKIGNVKVYPIVHKYFDSTQRAGRNNVDQYGNRLESHRAIFMSLGDIDVNNPQIELLSLGDRAMKRGAVNGINKGGDMANSVDAKHEHILSETAIANKDINGIAEMYCPQLDKSKFYVTKA